MYIGFAQYLVHVGVYIASAILKLIYKNIVSCDVRRHFQYDTRNSQSTLNISSGGQVRAGLRICAHAWGHPCTYIIYYG